LITREREVIHRLLTGVALFVMTATAVLAGESIRPNIIFIMSDDHATNAISAYGGRLSDFYKTPNIDRLAKQGGRMDNVFATNSICTPSRATILSGQYSHTNGVKTLGGKLNPDNPTIVTELKKVGYQTAVVGKWHLKAEPKDFDYYNVLPGQGNYYDPGFKEKGKPWIDGKAGKGEKIEGYVTDITTDISLDWLENRDKNKPFFIMIHNKAPHGPWQPARRHEHQFDGKTVPEPASLRERGNHGPGPEVVVDGVAGFQFGSSISRRYNERSYTRRFLHKAKKDNQEKKAMGHKIPPLPPVSEEELAVETGRAYQHYLKNYLGTVSAVDENVGRVIDWIDANGLADNTIIVYTSDQGMMLGEHDYGDKRWIYEESIRMPFIVRYPAKVPARSVSANLHTNVDIAPTLLAWAGIVAPAYMEGSSFAASLGDPADAAGEEAIYYRYWMHMAHHYNPAHYGIRTKTHKLVFFHGLPDKESDGQFPPTPPYWELYDLVNDPLEMNNIYHDPAAREIREALKQQLLALKEEVGDTDEGNDRLMAVRAEYWNQ
jgi:arylsulfatase A-like enzyme